MEEIRCVLTRLPHPKNEGIQTLGCMAVYEGVHKIYETKVLELPWKDNQRNISCIAEGEYWVRKRSAEESASQNEDHFIVEDVPNRSYILWHPGNYHYHIKGCQLHGQSFTDINNDGLLDVTNTKYTIAKLIQILPNRFKFKIISAC